jgi:hypothetical protein
VTVTISGRLIHLSDPAWTAVLAAADHDFYHLPCYQQLAARPDEVPRAFLAEAGPHRMLIPFLQRPVPADLAGGEPLSDAGSAYGYPGPVATRGAPGDFRRGALGSFAAALEHEGIVAGFFRLHTLLNPADDFAGIGELVNHGPSVYIDLTLSEEELWAQTRRGHKRDLVVLEQRGYEIVMDRWDRLDDFMTCYYDSMRRLNASPFYFFPKSYFEGLKTCLGDRIHLCLVYLAGDIACAGLVTEMNGLCQYHLSATADAHFQDHPSKLMLHHLRSWLKRRGNRIYHVGGGVGSLRDTLHLFKSGFSPLAADFHTWRLVGDEARYRALVERWSALTGREPVERAAFFPQYRAPLEG